MQYLQWVGTILFLCALTTSRRHPAIFMCPSESLQEQRQPLRLSNARIQTRLNWNAYTWASQNCARSRNGGELFPAYPLTSSSQFGLPSLSSPTDSKPQSCQRKPLNHSQLLPINDSSIRKVPSLHWARDAISEYSDTCFLEAEVKLSLRVFFRLPVLVQSENCTCWGLEVHDVPAWPQKI